MAGQIAELAKDTLPGDYREIDTGTARILLVEAGPRVLAGIRALALGQGRRACSRSSA